MSCLNQISSKHVFDKRTLLTIINALVFSEPFYCSSIRANTSKRNVSKLQLSRTLESCPEHANLLISYHIISELKWLLGATQLYFRNAVMAFKCLTSRVPEYLSSQFIKQGEISRCTTRSSQCRDIPYFSFTTRQTREKYTIRFILEVSAALRRNITSVNIG